MTLKGWMLDKVNADGHARTRHRASAPLDAQRRGRRSRAARAAVCGALGDAARRLSAPSPSISARIAPLIAAIREELEQFVDEPAAPASRDRRARPLRAHVDRGRVRRQRRGARAPAPVHPRVQARADQALPREGSDRRAAQRERDRPLAVRRAQRRAPKPTARAATTSAYGELLAELASAHAARRGTPVSGDARRTLVGARCAARRAATDDRRGLGRPRTPLAARALDDRHRGRRRRRRVELAVGRCRDAATPSARARAATSSSTASTRAAGIARSGSTTARGGSPTPGRPTAFASSRRAACSHATAPDARSAARQPAIELPPGARLVLSAHTAGRAAAIPAAVAAPGRRTGRQRRRRARRESRPATPVTPIARAAPARARVDDHRRAWPPARAPSRFRSGALPFRIGRSRNQALVIDWAHEDVSGHHVDIVALDEAGVTVVVHGDNGVTVDGDRSHGPGAEFRWKAGRDARARPRDRTSSRSAR